MQEINHSISAVNASWARKSVWRMIVAGFVTVLVISGLFCWIVDPFGLYQTGIFDPISEINTYQYKLTLFKRYKPPPEVIVLGSSGADQLIAPDDVTDLTGMGCFNYCTSGATTEIYYATMRLLLEQLKAPVKAVIVGTEPLAFMPDERPIHPMAKSRYEYTRYFTDDPVLPVMYERYSRLWSMEQVTSAYRSIAMKLHGEGIEGWRQWGPDGAPHHDWANRPGGIDEATRTRQDVINSRNIFKPGKFKGISAERKKYWEMFLDYCKENDIKVYAFLVPDHPDKLTELRKIGAEPIFQEFDNYMQSSVAKVDGVFYDFRDLKTFGGDVKYFHDGVHQTSENGRPLLEILLTDSEPAHGEGGS